ncbi:MAG: O-antigen ligase family protein, partial [Xanthomonadales bacterium]|nr:O-antigen ligase family protein [Xanthomonadales bacterium]
MPIALPAAGAAAVVVLAVLALLPLGRLSELPVAIAALGAIVLVVRGRIDLRGDPAMRDVVALFACYWLPIALSGFAAVDPAKTWSTAAASLRYLPFAVFAVHALRKDGTWSAVVLAISALVSLWLIDAWVQFVTGHSLGGAPEPERLSGIFGADNLKLGPVLAVLSPFVLVASRALLGRVGLLLAFLVVLVPVLLSGSRAAWLSYAIVVTLMAWCETGSLRRFAPLLVGVALAFVIAILGVRVDSGGFQARIERSLRAAEGTSQALDEASAGRISIWRTAIDMALAHPLTGVGARGFRHDYGEHARADDRFVRDPPPGGVAHAHQIVLEVASETGLVGLAGWLTGLAVMRRAWRRADPAARARAFAPALALVAMCFPLNTHLAFYSAWWGLLFWWLLALYCAALATPRT